MRPRFNALFLNHDPDAPALKALRDRGVDVIEWWDRAPSVELMDLIDECGLLVVHSPPRRIELAAIAFAISRKTRVVIAAASRGGCWPLALLTEPLVEGVATDEDLVRRVEEILRDLNERSFEIDDSTHFERMPSTNDWMTRVMR